jgi:hypothetical protein
MLWRTSGCYKDKKRSPWDSARSLLRLFSASGAMHPVYIAVLGIWHNAQCIQCTLLRASDKPSLCPGPPKLLNADGALACGKKLEIRRTFS